MSGKVLVAYATACGSTAGVAAAIGERLAEAGLEVEVRRISEVADLGAYRAVVLGSAIQSSRWLPEAMEFLKANQSALNQVPVAVFLVCLTLKQSGGKYLRYVEGYLDPVRALVKPVGEGLFAGAMRFADHPFFTRLAMRFWFLVAGLEEGDHRDWAAIREWADRVRPALGGDGAVPPG